MTAGADEALCRPDQHGTGCLEVAPFFSRKPVAGGRVQPTGRIYGVVRCPVLDLSGQTGAPGRPALEFGLPDDFVGDLGVAGLIV